MLPRYQRRPKARKEQTLGQCAICMEDIRAGNVFLGDCGHSFHSHCIEEWLKKQNTCPLDRKQIDVERHFKKK